MKYLILLLIPLLLSVYPTRAVKESEKSKDDKEFELLIKEMHNTLETNKVAQVSIDKKNEEAVQQTLESINTIKTELITTKKELHEVKQVLDSVSNDTAVSFKLLPISHYQEN